MLLIFSGRLGGVSGGQMRQFNDKESSGKSRRKSRQSWDELDDVAPNSNNFSHARQVRANSYASDDEDLSDGEIPTKATKVE